MTPAGTPSREEVRQVFLDMLAERISREDASSWANTWLVEERTEVDDPVVWDGLSALSGVGLRVNEADYQHSEADIQDWLDRLENAIEREREG